MSLCTKNQAWTWEEKQKNLVMIVKGGARQVCPINQEEVWNLLEGKRI